MKKELRLVKLDDLKPYDGNPRRNNKSAQIVAKSIQTYGYINPIVVTDQLVVLAGHTRLKALRILGWTEAEVLVVSGLTKEQIDGFVIADNRVGEFSQWNYSAVDKLVSKTTKDPFMKELGITSFTENKSELEKLINA
jgi:site-specific DNA-methyltransferase (adenine-specific)